MDVSLEEAKYRADKVGVNFVHPVEIKNIENFNQHPRRMTSNHSFGNKLLCFGNVQVQMLLSHEQSQMAQANSQQAEIFSRINVLKFFYYYNIYFSDPTTNL